MSKTIEQKVVEMRFDNSNFERNVSQSMTTLGKLQDAIDKTSSGNAFAGLSKAVDNLNFGSVTSAIQTVTEKFSLWEEIAIGAARNIGAALSNYVVKGLNDMVFSNVTAGWDKYAQKTEAVQTIMASIQDQDFGDVSKMEYVSGVLEKLNWFTDETSFHFTDMVSSIGKFTSAGVDLEKASDAMMGIATWAAVSGANANTASRVMYQLSQSLGMGSVRAQDWMSVETANMATKEFKELAISVAKAKGEITKSGKAKNGGKKAAVVDFKNFRETLKDGWLTSEVLNETLSQYSSAVEILNRTYYALGEDVPTSRILPLLEEAFNEAGKGGKKLEEVFTGLIEEEWGDKLSEEFDLSILDENGKRIGSLADKVTELGIRAFRAGQEAKTFAEALGSVPDAASTVWMQIWEKVFGDYETAKVLWTDLANYLYDIFVQPLWKVWDVIDEWQSGDGRELLFGRGETGKVEDATGAFYIMFETIKNVESAFMKAFGEVFPFGGENLVKISRKIQDFAKRTRVAKENVEELTNKFKNFFQFFKDIIDSIDIFNQKSEDSWNWIGAIKQRFEDTFGRVENVLERVKSIIEYIKDGFIAFFDALKFNGTSIQNFGDTAENLGEIGNDLAKALSPITLIFKNMAKFGKNAGTFISDLVAALSFIPKEITGILRNTGLLSWGADLLQESLKAVKEGFNEAFDKAIFADIVEMFKYVWGAIESFITGFQSKFNIYDKIKTIFKGIGSAVNLLGRAIQFLLTPIKKLTELGVFTELGKFLGGTVVNVLMSIPATIAKIVSKLDEFIKEHPRVQEVWEGISTIFASIIKFVLTAANAISDFIKESSPLSKVGGWVKDLFSSFKDSELLTSIGEKVSDAFDSVVKFFNEDLTLENFKTKVGEAKDKIKDFIETSEILTDVKTWFDGVTDSVKKFIDESEFLSNVKTSLKELWENIKKLFGGEENFEGFGANFMSGFAKGLVDNAKIVYDTVKKFAGEMIQKLKDFFGIHSPSTETEEIGTSLIDGLVKGLKEGLKTVIDAVRMVGKPILQVLNSLLFGKGSSTDSKKTEENVKNASDAISNIKVWLGGISKKLLGIGAIALPSIAITKAAKGISSLMSPFTALKKALAIGKIKVIADGIVNGIAAFGGAVKDIVLSLGGFLIMLAAAIAIISVADKYSNGGAMEAMKIMIAIIGEMMTAITILSTILAKNGKGAIGAGGDLQNKTGQLSMGLNKTAENIEAMGTIFLQIGASMLMFAAAVGAITYLMGEYDADTVAAAILAIGTFLALVAIAAYVIGEYSDEQTESSATLNKKGLSFKHKGYTEGFYAVGAFMVAVGTAMLGLAASAALIMKASNGNIDVMNAAFQGMFKMLAITMGAIVLITYIQENSKQVKTLNSKSNNTIRDAAVALASITLAVKAMSKAVIMLGKEDPGVLKQGVKVIGEIGLVLFAFALLAANAKPSSMENAEGLGKFMRNLALTFAIVGLTVKVLGSMDSTAMSKGLKAIVTIGVLFGVVSSIMLLATGIKTENSEKQISALSTMLLKIAGAFVIMSVALRIMDGVENMGKVALGIGASFLAIGLLFGELAWLSSIKKVKVDELVGLASGFVIISSAFAVMAVAMRVMDGVSNMGQVITGLIVSFASIGALFAMVSLFADSEKSNDLLKGAGALAIVSVAISILMGIMAEAGTVFAQNEGALGKGVLALGAILLTLAGIAVIAVKAGPAMLKFGMGVAALGIGMLALSVGMLVFYNTLLLISSEVAVFGDALFDLCNVFLDNFIKLMPKITKAIVEFFKAIAMGIAGSAIEIVNAIVSVLQAIGDNIDKILDVLGPILDKIIPFVVEKITLLIDLIKPLVEGIVTHIAYLMEEILLPSILRCLQSIIDFISINIPALADMLVTTVESVVTRLLELIDYLINSEAGILAIISRALMGENGILTILDTFLHLLLADLRNLTTDLVDTIVYIIQELVDGIIDNIDIILTGVEDAINMVVDHIVSLTDTVLKGVVDVIEGIATAIENHGSDLWKAIWHVITAIWNSFWGIFDGDGENSISSLASKFMQGLGDGIKNFVGKVTGAISWVVGKIFGKFEEEAEIHSPSKVMAKMGEYLDLGLAEGIADASGSPINAISGLGGGIIDSLKSTFLGDDAGDITGMFGDNITDALSGSLGNMSDLLNTDDFTPTITPVLDLSEIQNGASQIPGMINSGSGYTVDTTAVVRGAYDPYQYYDGTERVSTSEAQMDYFEAIKTKMDEVVSKFGNAKVVLDTGAVVGGIVDPMDMALGQRMAQVGRGVIASSR